MEKQSKVKSLGSPKRKRKLPQASESEPKTTKLTPLYSAPETTDLKKKKGKKVKQKRGVSATDKTEDHKFKKENFKLNEIDFNTLVKSEDKYPVLKDNTLIDKFMSVPLNNNQKGRIRQAVKMQLQGSSDQLYPDIIHGKIQSILKSSENLTDSELRRVRILYNMLKTSLHSGIATGDESAKKTKKVKKVVKENKDTDKPAKKVKGPKRYVVFMGNLPLNVTKEKIMNHFSELNEHIKDIRIPKLPDGNKSAIAYVELSNEPSYELALSKHHTMMGSKRINILYTMQKKSKITKTEAKSKSAKLIALHKSGKLVGSVPVNKKRSHRRMIQRKARALEAAGADTV